MATEPAVFLNACTTLWNSDEWGASLTVCTVTSFPFRCLGIGIQQPGKEIPTTVNYTLKLETGMSVISVDVSFPAPGSS